MTMTAFGFTAGFGASMAQGMVSRSRSAHWTLGVPLALAALAALAGLALAGSGCGAAAGSNRPLPSYAGHATELFDDGIEPAAVGLDLEQATSPRTDALLRERAQVSDAAMRVRIADLTEKQDGADSIFLLGVHPLETLAGPFPPEGDFTVTVHPRTPSVGIIKSLNNAVVGKTFVAFVRAFVLSDGDRELHFHFAPDTKPEVAAVREATQKTEQPH
jgi:hypothetical protein